MKIEEMVEKFQCPGCVAGSDTDCGAYRFSATEQRCVKHVLGTIKAGAGSFALGLPTGFCKSGWNQHGEKPESKNTINVRLWLKGAVPKWDLYNIPVWALEKDGFLFVRTYAPRSDFSWVDVVEAGSLALVPQAINVGEDVGEMD